ncbi:hypothetical protein INT45_011561, partial [Circinella minor]
KEVSTRAITCFFYTGIKKVNFTFCKCEEASVTLLRHNLIASSPFLPRMAFHISLLKWYSLLRAEGQLSCQAFAYVFTTMHKFENNDTIRKNLANAFFLYEQVVNEIDQQLSKFELNEIPEEKKAACPACPTKEENSHMVVALDGLHSLRRIKRNEHDEKKATSPLFFTADSYQDRYGDDAEKQIPIDENDSIKKCTSNFDAANLSLQSLKNNRYHETGVFGCTCKHEMVLEMTTMYKSGEKYKYPLSLIQVLTEKYGSKIHLLFDIGCEFKKAVNKYFPQLEEAGSKVAIGVLHSYGHSMSCQSRHNPRYLDNFVGMADGESCERVWSFLGRFVDLCRQMSPERRMITIAHAIKHYNKKHIYTLPNTIKRRFNKANLTIRNANKIIKAYDPSLTDDLLQEKWRQFVEEVTFFPSPDSQPTINRLKRQYAIELHKFYQVELTGHIQQQRNIVADLEARLIGNQVITKRWGQHSEELKINYILANEHELEKIKGHLKSIIVGRTVLNDQLFQTIKLGHKASKRLKIAIQNVKKVAKPVLNRYNSICNTIGRPEKCTKYQEICNLQNKFWDFEVDMVNFNVLRQYLYKCRSLEELRIIKVEERRVKEYADRQCAALESCIRKDDVRGDGWKILLYHRLLDAEVFYFKVHGRKWKRSDSFIIPGTIDAEGVVYGRPGDGTFVVGEENKIEEDRENQIDEEKEYEVGEEENEAEIRRIYEDIENDEEDIVVDDYMPL